MTFGGERNILKICMLLQPLFNLQKYLVTCPPDTANRYKISSQNLKSRDYSPTELFFKVRLPASPISFTYKRRIWIKEPFKFRNGSDSRHVRRQDSIKPCKEVKSCTQYCRLFTTLSTIVNYHNLYAKYYGFKIIYLFSNAYNELFLLPWLMFY